jgi:hypothetical protein
VARVDGFGIGTVGHPPRIRIRIQEVFRGDVRPGSLSAVWLAESAWPEFRCGNETEDERRSAEREAARPVFGPLVGTRLLLSGYRSRGDSTWYATTDVRSRSPELWTAVVEAAHNYDRRTH